MRSISFCSTVVYFSSRISKSCQRHVWSLLSLQKCFTVSKSSAKRYLFYFFGVFFVYFFLFFFSCYEQGSILFGYFLLLGMWFYSPLFVSLANRKFCLFGFRFFFYRVRKCFVLVSFLPWCRKWIFFDRSQLQTSASTSSSSSAVFFHRRSEKVTKIVKYMLCALCLQDVLYIKISLIVSHLHWRASVS